MAITRDNSTLIVSDSMAGCLTAYDVEADGSLSNRRVWADGLGPDGICMDARGRHLSADTRHPRRHHRADSRGRRSIRAIEHDRAILATMLGGSDRATLFLAAVEWRGIEHVDEAVAARTGQILTARAPAPGVGWP